VNFGNGRGDIDYLFPQPMLSELPKLWLMLRWKPFAPKDFEQVSGVVWKHQIVCGKRGFVVLVRVFMLIPKVQLDEVVVLQLRDERKDFLFLFDVIIIIAVDRLQFLADQCSASRLALLVSVVRWEQDSVLTCSVSSIACRDVS
jgi:hypothetical protein